MANAPQMIKIKKWIYNPNSNEVETLCKTNKYRVQWFANPFRPILNWIHETDKLYWGFFCKSQSINFEFHACNMFQKSWERGMFTTVTFQLASSPVKCSKRVFSGDFWAFLNFPSLFWNVLQASNSKWVNICKKNYFVYQLEHYISCLWSVFDWIEFGVIISALLRVSSLISASRSIVWCIAFEKGFKLCLARYFYRVVWETFQYHSPVA